MGCPMVLLAMSVSPWARRGNGKRRTLGIATPISIYRRPNYAFVRLPAAVMARNCLMFETNLAKIQNAFVVRIWPMVVKSGSQSRWRSTSALMRNKRHATQRPATLFPRSWRLSHFRTPCVLRRRPPRPRRVFASSAVVIRRADSPVSPHCGCLTTTVMRRTSQRPPTRSSLEPSR